MSYRLIVDGDGEHAKECVYCKKTFYVGEVCQFCVISLPYCEKCHKIEIDGQKVLPLKAIFIIKDRMESAEKGSSERIKIKFYNSICNDCKTDELCKTPPLAICNER